MFYEKIQTPAYILEEDKLRKNCELLASVGEKSGAKVLLALKGFAFSGA
ncbi:TPA: carboxynorspermidine decarboxylase, partial [Campylobacter jejuni]|nr:carboxynorspermidine decarboxylase [Campylobacter jejuni]